jgi:nucleoside-diphosphate-sugar epimerase
MSAWISDPPLSARPARNSASHPHRGGAGAPWQRAAGADPVPGDLADLRQADSPAPNWLTELRGVDAVVHVAAHILLRRKSAHPLTNWLVSFTGRDRSYDITAAKSELGYSPDVTLEKGLAEMSSSRPAGTT